MRYENHQKNPLSLKNIKEQIHSEKQIPQYPLITISMSDASSSSLSHLTAETLQVPQTFTSNLPTHKVEIVNEPVKSEDHFIQQQIAVLLNFF